MVVDVRYVRMAHVHKEMVGGGGGGPEARGEERRRGEKRRGGRKKAPSEEPCMWRGSLQVRRVGGGGGALPYIRPSPAGIQNGGFGGQKAPESAARPLSSGDCTAYALPRALGPRSAEVTSTFADYTNKKRGCAPLVGHKD